MIRLSTVATLVALATLATPVVVSATGATPSAPRAETRTPAAVPAPVTPELARCDRPVRVVYAGYGEAAQACAR